MLNLETAACAAVFLMSLSLTAFRRSAPRGGDGGDVGGRRARGPPRRPRHPLSAHDGDKVVQKQEPVGVGDEMGQTNGLWNPTATTRPPSSTCWCLSKKRNIGPRRKRSTNWTIQCNFSSRFSSRCRWARLVFDSSRFTVSAVRVFQFLIRWASSRMMTSGCQRRIASRSRQITS